MITKRQGRLSAPCRKNGNSLVCWFDVLSSIRFLIIKGFSLRGIYVNLVRGISGFEPGRATIGCLIWSRPVSKFREFISELFWTHIVDSISNNKKVSRFVKKAPLKIWFKWFECLRILSKLISLERSSWDASTAKRMSKIGPGVTELRSPMDCNHSCMKKWAQFPKIDLEKRRYSKLW